MYTLAIALTKVYIIYQSSCTCTINSKILGSLIPPSTFSTTTPGLPQVLQPLPQGVVGKGLTEASFNVSSKAIPLPYALILGGIFLYRQ